MCLPQKPKRSTCACQGDTSQPVGQASAAPAARQRALRLRALPRVVALLTVALAAALWIDSAQAAPAPWCGGDARTSSNRLPDLQLSPHQIRVVYATPSDGPDNFAADAPLIAADASAIDAWW